MRSHSSMNDAIAKLLKVIADNPQRWDAYQQLARVLLRNNEFNAAEQYFLQAIQIKPDEHVLHLQLADLQMRTQQFKAAHDSYKKAIKLQPKQAQTYFLDAQALKNMGRANEAILRLHTAFKLAPSHIQAFTECVDLLLKQSQIAEAAEILALAIQNHPENALLHFRLGMLNQQLKDPQQALTCLRQATELQPEFAEAHHQYALLLHATGKLDASIKSFDTAIQLQPQVPSAYNNRGVVLCQMRKLSHAIADFKQAIALNPSYASAYCNLGVAQYEHGEDEAAYQTLEAALKYEPTHVQAQYTLSLLKLRKGEYDTGWSLYESRWKIKPATHPLNETLRWRGETDLRGKTIFVFAEQSLSDTLQFCRYIPLLKQYKPNQIIVEVQEALFALLNQHWSNEPLIQIIKTGGRLPHYEAYCPMLGLPDAFKTRLHNIPDKLPYLRITQNHQQPWLDLLGPTRRLRVGLNWCGDANNPQDHLRSIPLFMLASLLKMEVEWHSLQKEFRREDHIILKRFPMLECHHQQLVDFTDTAGLIMQMDLVISVDTAVAHLAAALGKPVWLLIPEQSHFRWLQQRTDSPWYPEMRLFRMQSYQQWEDLADEVHQALTERVAAQRRTLSRPAPLVENTPDDET